jgi:hypothetical protein
VLGVLAVHVLVAAGHRLGGAAVQGDAVGAAGDHPVLRVVDLQRRVLDAQEHVEHDPVARAALHVRLDPAGRDQLDALLLRERLRGEDGGAVGLGDRLGELVKRDLHQPGLRVRRQHQGRHNQERPERQEHATDDTTH